MFIFFLFLTLLALIGLIVGLISPTIYSGVYKGQLTRSKVTLVFTIATIVFFVIAVIITPRTQETTQNGQETTQQSNKLPELKYAYDVPSLFGKNIDEIKQILGQPVDKDIEPNTQQTSLGVTEWYNTYKKDNKELVVTFNPKTRRITDFFIGTDDPSGKTKNKAHLLELGNLKENDPKYKIEFVKVIKEPSSFTGVKAIPN